MRLGWIASISARSALRRRRETLLILIVVAVANALLLFQLAQGHGQERAFMKTMIGSLTGHIRLAAERGGRDDEQVSFPESSVPLRNVQDLAQLVRRESEVQATAPRVSFGAMLARGEESEGVFAVGIDPDEELGVCDAIKLDQGRFVTAGKDEIVVSSAFAEERKLQVGSKVILLATTVDGSFNAIEFSVVGMLSGTFFAKFYKSMVYIPIQRARRLLGLEDSEAYELVAKLDSEMHAGDVAGRLAGKLKSWSPPVAVTT